MNDSASTIITIDKVTKRFGSVVAVNDVSFDIRRNEFFALLGPSGCGKTTLLRMIAGFETMSEGRILIDGADIAPLPPNRRPVNMVFQSYAVFPHMTVSDNVGYGLRVEGAARDEIAPRVAEALDMVKLGDYGARRPDQLSGGQRQRVALARALVKRPKVLLLDEPLSALDAKLREQMQLELSQLQRDVGITFIIVTHDQDEALSMADRVAVMRDGEVDQIADPGDLYENPANRFVADFIGKVNLLEGQVVGGGSDGVTVDVAGLGRIVAPYQGDASGAVSLAIRPEKIRIAKAAPAEQGMVTTRGRIAEWAYYGDTSHMLVDTESGLRLGVVVQNLSRQSMNALDVGDEVHVAFAPGDTLVLNS